MGKLNRIHRSPANICSRSAIEALEKGVKYSQRTPERRQ